MRETIDKGATRPAMVWGIPLPAFIALVGSAFLLCVWGIQVVGLWMIPAMVLAVAPPAIWMHAATRRDDQRLHQFGLLLRLRLGHHASAVWGAARSYSPIRYRSTTDAWRG
jgi:type IV secretion system protein VirB3